MNAAVITSLSLAVLVSMPAAGEAVPAVAINEVLANPLDEDTGEFVELFNWGDAPVDVAGWRLADAADTNDRIQDYSGPHDWGLPGTAIPPGGYALIVDPEYAGQYTPFLQACSDSGMLILLTIGKDTTIGNGLTNAQDLVLLSDGGIFVATFGWSSDPGQGVSWEKIEAPQGDGASNWAPCRQAYGSTPGARNSVSRALYDVQVPVEEIKVTPRYPQPGQEVHITARVYNGGKMPAEGVQVHFFHDQDADTLLDDGEQIGTAQSISGAMDPGECVELGESWGPPVSGRQQLAVWARYDQDEDPADNHAALAVQVRFVPGIVVINEIMYAPSPADGDSEKEPEWVEILHLGAEPIDLFGWTIEDSRGQPQGLCDSAAWFHQGDYAVVAGGDPEDFHSAHGQVPGMVLFPSGGLPSLNNSEDQIVLRDPAGTPVDSILYDATWGGGSGISLERINPCLGTNDDLNWSWCVHPSGSTPGRRNSIFTPVIPHQAALSAAPNPFSPDGDGHREVTIISYRLPSAAARMSLRLFDVRGRAVRTLVDQRRCPAEGDVIWDGRSDGGEILTLGIYILYLEALDERRGLICRKKTTVVVGGRLD